jgi:hypothetical protein
MNRLALLICSVLILAGCIDNEPPPPSVATLIEDPTLLDSILERCTAGIDELRASQECVNARRAVDVIAAQEAEKTPETDLEAESERKRAALRRQRERVTQRVQQAEELLNERTAEKEAEELTGSAEYVDELAADEPVELPPTMLPGSAVGSAIEERPLPELDETGVCTIVPSNLSDADLVNLLNALQKEWQRRQSRMRPAMDDPAMNEPAMDDPTEVFSGGGGGG